jgi:hypothetical protein
VSFDSLVSTAYRICISTQGEPCTFTAQAPGSLPIAITGIIKPGVELEGQAPLDGSMNATIHIHAQDIPMMPLEGDEIASVKAVYKVVRVLAARGDQLALHLRQDRLLT